MTTLTITIDNNYPSEIIEYLKKQDNQTLVDMLIIGNHAINRAKIMKETESKSSCSTSYIIGKEGEQIVKDIITQKYNLLDVSKTSYSGDCVILHDNFKIVVESKNYSKKVPTTEITKFRRDVTSNNYHAGILVSLSSNIVKYENTVNIIYEVVNGIKIPIILLTDKNMLLSCIELLLIMLNNTNESIKITTTMEKTIVTVESIKRLIEELQISNVRQFNKINSAISIVSSTLRDELNQ